MFFNWLPTSAKEYGNMLINQLGFAFVNGLISSLSACVYPLIPVTTALFGAGQVWHWSKGLFLSLIYVTGMSLTYVALGIAASLGGSVFGAYMGNPSVIILFSLIFFLLGLGFLGVIPMPLPNFANSMQVKKSNSLWYPLVLGIFSGFIAAPCTAPLFGALLIEIASHSAQQGNLFSSVAQALAFSFGMGLPFLLIGGFALRLPKPGNWLGAVKYIGAAVLFAAAFHYAEDLFAPFPVAHLPLWIVSGIVLFVFGIYFSYPMIPPEKKENSPNPFYHKASYTMLLLVAGFGLFLATSPFASSSHNEKAQTQIATDPNAELQWMYDLNAAKLKAQKEQRPIMVDFYADWCVACGKMKEQLFPTSEFKNFVQERNLILVKLDFTETDEEKEKLAESYVIPGLPALIFLSPKGTMFDQVLGFRSTQYAMEKFSAIRWDKIDAF